MPHAIMRKAALLLAAIFGFTAISLAQTVTGSVTDKKGEPLPGVTVTVKGTRNASSTNNQGIYTLNNVGADAILVFTGASITPQEVPVGGQAAVNAQLETSVSSLNEIVMVGYTAQRRRDLTGSVTTVKAKDFNQGVIVSADQLIQGKSAGLQVVSNNGAPGAATTIRVRGNSSIRSGNNPLFVVDGIPLDGRLARPGFAPVGLGNTPESNPLYFLNANDIASMDVQKDAAATAIYGSRGANGVVVITTKQGTGGAAKLDVMSSVGVSSISKKFKILDASGYRQALAAYNITTGDKGDNVDPVSEILQNGVTQNYGVGISGGSDNGKYRISFGYLDQNGIVKNTNLQRFTINANGQYKFLPSRKLSLDFNIFAGQARENIAPITNDAGAQGNLISTALQWNPTEALYKDDGTVNVIPGSSTINPVALQNGYVDISNINSLFGIVNAGYAITNGLDYKMRFSLNRQSGSRKSAMARNITIPGVENLGLGARGTSEMTTMVLQHLLNYEAKVSSGFTLGALIGYEYQKFSFSGSSIVGIGFANDDKPFYNILQNSPTSTRTISAFEDPTSSIQSYFTQLKFNIKDKYLITGTLRADGSSKFGSNNRYGYFPSVAAAWNVSNEDFLKNSTVISNLKIRASYGLTGNQAFPSGSAQTQWGYAANGGGLFQINVANPDLKWETTTQLNVGADFQLAKGRISGSIDYFTRETKDILFSFAAIQPAPAVSVWKNIENATIKNSGVEISLGGTLITSKDLVWNLNVNTTFLQNEFNNYDGPPILTGAINGQGLSGAFVQRIDNGQPLNAFYTRRFLGFDGQTGQGTYANDEAPEYVGNPNPTQLLGISTDVTYKKLSLVVNMNGAFGHVIYNNTLNAVMNIGNLGTRNIGAELLDLNPREAISNPIKTSSRYLESGNFLRLANISLAYNVGNIGNVIKNASVFVTGQNLAVFTNFQGFDPEVNVDKNIGGVPSFGIEYIPYPAARTYQVGIKFGL
jgi:iron complex outermembrane receptor protein